VHKKREFILFLGLKALRLVRASKIVSIIRKIKIVINLYHPITFDTSYKNAWTADSQ
jgi:hypothetical protein